jgi:crotonobetainyl-CoA:carnitine CoA-transferase CaiB-like acyl-CoA transferase
MAALTEARDRGAGFEELFAIRDARAVLASPFSLYYRIYAARDGAIALGALTPQNRDAIRHVLGIFGEECSDSPDFDAADPASRTEISEWRDRLEREFASRRVSEWLALFEAAGAPAARVNFAEEMTDDPQANADGMFLELDHTITGTQRVVGPLVLMTATPTGSALPAPTLGEHTRSVLAEAGLGDDEVANLLADGVVASAD